MMNDNQIAQQREAAAQAADAIAARQREVAAERTPVTPSSLTLERLLEDLARYGAPRLMQLGGGWHCGVDVKVNATGCEFKVLSKFDHQSPHAAAACAHQRLREALRDLGVAGAGGLA